MKILQKILDWSTHIPKWQSDALARLLTKPMLTNDDYDDLFSLLKLEHDIRDPKNRRPNPLSSNHIPDPNTSSSHVVLKSMKNLKNVNAIAENQCLSFGTTGLTIIYGDNGSGKSGYTRVLKHACRARDRAEVILPNAKLPINNTGVASAVFEIEVNSEKPIDVEWINDETPPLELSSLAIFDSRCARAYLDEEDDFSYVPYGLDVFEGLANICNQLKNMINFEISKLNIDLNIFAPLRTDTEVGKLISSLSARTSIEQIEILAILKSEDLTLYDKLHKSLIENNPKEKANQLRMCARRMDAIKQKIITNESLVNQDILDKFIDLVNKYHIAKNASEVAAKQLKEDSNLLSGTGGEAWRILFEAARNFSKESHPDKDFPNLGKNALCPLCQQPLGESASRLIQFEDYVKKDAEKNFQKIKKIFNDEYNNFISQKLRLDIEDVIYAEIKTFDPQLGNDIREFEQAIIIRQKKIAEAIMSGKYEEIGQSIVSPAFKLQSLCKTLNEDAKILENASDEKEREKLQRQFNELDARKKLNDYKNAVIETVKKLIYKNKLEKCLPDLNTKPISIKSSELTNEVVKIELANALNAEFDELGAGSLKVSLQSRSDRGKALHKLKLELPQARKPGDILSEGEQRAIAIGSFLAEVSLSGGKGGIVFDDPVSSLDHLRREYVAKRLAKEALNRQVILFTHDIYFLCILVENAKAVNAQITTQSLIFSSEGCGIADPDTPFQALSTRDRVGRLMAKHRTNEMKEYKRQIIEAYGQLRMAWEHSVEEVLFRDVVTRFRKKIETSKLSGVCVEDADYQQIKDGMTKCSNFTGHDSALLTGVSVPIPTDLLADINALENWRKAVEDRSKEITKRRKN